MDRRKNSKRILVVFLVLLASLAAAIGYGREQIRIFQGEVQVMRIGKVARVAIGNPKIASNTILPNGQLVLLGDSPGVTTVHIWLADGGEKEFDIEVRSKSELDKQSDLDRLLGEIRGLHRIRVGDLVIVKGEVDSDSSRLYDRILDRYQKEIIDLTTRSSAREVRSLLATVPGIQVTNSGGQTVISGEIGREFAPVVQAVASRYPKVLNLTRSKAAIAGKMVYMKVRIMEMGRNFLEKIGIDWTSLSGITGPSFQFGVETVRNQGTILNSDGISGVMTKPGGSSLTSARGYFGIATGLNSILNFYESTGDAVTLAEPRLSARSGGKAEFLAGGEIPLPTTSTLGQTNVEFKKYGISLQIQPVVDSHDNILAHLETEVSSVDQANAVNNIPAFKTRKTSTDISMREKQTLVIAGLLNDQASKGFNNLPYLADIPVLGKLFSSREFRKGHTELVVFVTPTIYDADSELNRVQLQKLEEMEHHMGEIIGNNQLMD